MIIKNIMMKSFKYKNKSIILNLNKECSIIKKNLKNSKLWIFNYKKKMII